MSFEFGSVMTCNTSEPVEVCPVKKRSDSVERSKRREEWVRNEGPVKCELRLRVKARGFWRRGKDAWFDVRVTHVNAVSQRDLPTAAIFHRHQQEKKRSYSQRCMEVENGTFTPLVFGTNGGVESECSMFLATLAEKLSVVRSEDVNLTMEWLRAKLSFEVLRSALLCVRGSKKAWYKKGEVKISQDFGLSVVEAGL